MFAKFIETDGRFLFSTDDNGGVEITGQDHATLLSAHGSGSRIVPDERGRPVLSDPPAMTDAELAAAIRAERNTKISACDWTVLSDAPLTTTQKTNWKAYRQALRDITEQPGFPSVVEWPEAPK